MSSCWCRYLHTQNTAIAVVGRLLTKNSGLAEESKPAQFSKRSLAQSIDGHYALAVGYLTVNGSVRLILLAPYFM